MGYYRMASPVCSALGIDLDDISGKLVAIAEHHGSDANFVLSCLIAERIQKKSGICLLALHNTFGHYHNVGMKLGYNLQKLKEKKSVQTIELLKLVSNIHNDSRELKDERFDILAEDKEDITTNKSVCLVIDDISDLLTWGIPVKEVCSFLQYCRTFLYEVSGFSLVILSHFITGDEDNLILMSGFNRSVVKLGNESRRRSSGIPIGAQMPVRSNQQHVLGIRTYLIRSSPHAHAKSNDLKMHHHSLNCSLMVAVETSFFFYFTLNAAALWRFLRIFEVTGGMRAIDESNKALGFVQSFLLALSERWSVAASPQHRAVAVAFIPQLKEIVDSLVSRDKSHEAVLGLSCSVSQLMLITDYSTGGEGGSSVNGRGSIPTRTMTQSTSSSTVSTPSQPPKSAMERLMVAVRVRPLKANENQRILHVVDEKNQIRSDKIISTKNIKSSKSSASPGHNLSLKSDN
uniref:Elongator complex protein 6 n=1 Tax=Timema californicum TaxID=61474 RepID=A0A7R9P794_TIMCA|nr:unnamed protein product [Timema californicum]